MMEAEVVKQYGVIEVHDWIELDLKRQAAVKLANDGPQERTFREDYEIYGAAEGVVRVEYSGNCTACGLSTSFSHDHPIATIEANTERKLGAVERG